ncbi:MAG: glucose-6-phosphate dehydrogenase [Gammaproteobacteria bacterium]|nr:glucose-6-phosphate dehydrogenase [Gammaproteobacteria bacterium]
MPTVNPNSSEHSQSLVLFGALGDLSLRKLLPALFQLDKANLLTDDTRILGLARKPYSDTEFTQAVAQTLSKFVAHDELDSATKQRFLQRLNYLQLDMKAPQAYEDLKLKLADWGSHITYYLATPPSIFGDICSNLNATGLNDPTSRIVLEKPIGHDLASSQVINDTVGSFFTEEQIYRIDHYLGKETVQNLLALRFANPIFADLWSHDHISYVEITVAEEVGIEGRWGYFDHAGQMRDMVQNHLLQLLCLVAMEPPSRLDADSIRNEKVRVLKALQPMHPNTINQYLVRGQYGDGHYQNQTAPGYLNEPDANTTSQTETYMALRADIANWRWAGTPFYLRTGKRMRSKATEIIIHFRPSRHFIFASDQESLAQNKLVIRLQPYEGIALQTLTKEQGIDKGMRLRRDPLNLDFAQTQGHIRIPDAYERLLLEALKGDQSLFVRRDEVEAAWQWCDQIRATWQQSASPLHTYPAGTQGPHAAYDMINAFGHHWYEHC